MAQPGRQALRNFGPFVVPLNQYFMMGDSRDNSADSRFIGPVPRAAIVGRVPRVIFSFDPSRHFLPRPQRILQPMHLDGT
jgi:signal peptidase I